MDGAGLDVVVVGAGAIGLSAAVRLAAEGARVTVLEAGEPGREASWAAGGILSPVHPYRYPAALNVLADRSLALWPEVTRDLEVATGISLELRASGLVRLALDAQDQEVLDAAIAWRSAHGLAVERLDAAGLLRTAPLASPLAKDALFEPELRQLRPPRLLRALRLRAARLGVDVRAHDPAVDLLRTGERVTGVRAASGPVEAQEVVLAAGAWSGDVLRRALGIVLPVTPVRGAMLLFEPRELPAVPSPMILGAGGRYLIPRACGRILCGSTLEHAGFEKRVTEDARRELQAAAIRLAPSLASARLVKSWAGLRPGSADALPYIGRVGGVAGLIVATGHYRNGILLAPVTAEAVARLARGLGPAIDLAAFAPERAVAAFQGD